MSRYDSTRTFEPNEHCTACGAELPVGDTGGGEWQSELCPLCLGEFMAEWRMEADWTEGAEPNLRDWAAQKAREREA